ncbi:MAG: O-antigen ligase family protein [Gammaproteobacteria bacterium]|nr:O-antigen ligase family protein [Gammaproteobacteria bacterium]
MRELSSQIIINSNDPKSTFFEDCLLLLYILGFVGFGLVSFLPDVVGVDSRVVTVPFRLFVLLLSLGIILAALLQRKMCFNMGFKLFIVFWMFYLLRVFFYFLSPDLEIEHFAERYLLFAVVVSVIPSLAFFACIREVFLRRIEVILYSCLSLIVIVSILLYLRSGVPVDRLTGNSAQNPIEFGHISVSLIFLSLLFIFEGKGSFSFKKIVSLIMLFFGIGGLVLSASRGPLMSLIVVIVALLIFSKKRITSPKLANLFFLFIVLVILIPIVVSVAQNQGVFVAHVFDLPWVETFSSSALDIRIVLWKAGLKVFLNNPIFGDFFSFFGFEYPHNIVIEAFSSAGIFMGIMLIVLIIHGVTRAIRLIKLGINTQWLGLLYLQFLIGSMFSGSLCTSDHFWYAYACVIAACSASKKTATLDKHRINS